MTVRRDIVKKVPPDGGYGWVIVFAYALNNMIFMPLYFSFGLVFKEVMSDVNLSHSQCSLVLILNNSMSMVMTLLGGPLLRRFGYRKVAACGGIFSSLGLLATSFTSNFWMFIVWYSIVNSIGVGTTLSSFTLALNTFFKEKRGRAVGVGLSFMGLGSILMPLLISKLLTAFGWRYAVLILSSLCLHSLTAACLLRPVKWYLRFPPHSEEKVPLNKDANKQYINSTNNKIDIKYEENADLLAKSESMAYLASATGVQARNTVSHSDMSEKSPEYLPKEKSYNLWESQEINLGSSINIFGLNEQERKKSDAKEKFSIKEELQKTTFRKFIDFFDLTILSDPIFVNILFGMAIATSVENNFFILLPIILEDITKFETEQIAMLMSIIGITDTIFRLVTPFIGEWCKRPPRIMFLGGLLLIILIRIAMLFASSFLGMVFVALAIGVTKGYRIVYNNIIIPSYVPIERLPCAWGIQMFTSGVISIVIGSMLGPLREISGGYHFPLVVLNFIIMWTVITWIAEFIYIRIKNKNNGNTTKTLS